MRFGLLLGGGGSVGIAWENGVLAGLQDSIGFDPTMATVIVGTSAGSSVGADMALGKDPHRALALDDEPAQLRRTLELPDMESGPFAEIIGLMLGEDARTPETAAKIGRLAVEAPTALSPKQWTDMFERTVGTSEWPEVDFRATATCCSTGEPVVWTAADEVDLAHAVASSCAVPGIFPPVLIGDEHYMDGARGTDYHDAITEPLGLDAAIYIGPKIAAVPAVVKMLEQDMAAIAARGTRVHTMLGSEALDAAGLNLMDFSARAEGFEIGLADGRAQAGAIAELLGQG